ncbi:MAG TPA: hypothetical protein ENH05_03860 [Rhizobiales bacterium]|nr:hypothetical protein BMS3Bbin10_01681 [bacterium BMS3Bbin10]HDO51855.1 hypothetical protein [Hyphomicrobiales bacterium]
MTRGRANAGSWRVLAALCAALALWPAASTPSEARAHAKSSAIKVGSERILFDRDKPGRRRYGKLEWLGTLRLTSPSPDFGGFSGLALDRTGTQMLAISDQGRWLGAEIVYREGRLEKLRNARIGRLRGLDGKPLGGKVLADSESVVFASPGTLTGKAYVSFERRHRIAEYKVTSAGFGAAIRNLKLPKRARSMSRNKGLEGIAMLRAGRSKGALLAFAEEYLDGQGDHTGWLIGGPAPGLVKLKRLRGFAVTDLASAGNGDVIILERRFRFSEGVKMRLRRVKAAEVKRGALLGGEILFETGDLREIDNMEGLAVHQDARGRDILTLISDNNFNTRLQRTLLMQFAIIE